jgi:hypothetical protein
MASKDNISSYGKNIENYSYLKLLEWWTSWTSNPHKNAIFVRNHPMTIHVQFGFNHVCRVYTFSHRFICEKVIFVVSMKEFLSNTIEPFDSKGG